MSEQNRICVGWDLGTVHCCMAAGPYEIKVARNGEASVAISPSAVLILPLARSAANPGILNTICAVVESNTPGISEVLWDSEARSHNEAFPNTPLLKYTKLVTLSPERLTDMADGKPREFGLSVIRKEQAVARAEMNRVGWTPVDFLAACFKAMWKLAMPKLEEQFLQNNKKFSNLEAPFIDIVVSRPSMWRLNDDHQLQEALKQALKHDPRVGEIHLCDESHVALFGITFNEANSEGLAENQIVAVSDLGGGTCDNASYTINSLSPFRASEAIGATGGFAGASIMHSQFETHLNDFVRPLLNTSASNDAWKVVCNDLVESYTSKLLDFTWNLDAVDEDIAFRLRASGAVWLRQRSQEKAALLEHGFVLCKGGLEVTHRKVTSLFRPYVDRISKLISRQVHDTQKELGRNVDRLFVVGGFSKNRYLQKELRDRLRTIIKNNSIKFPPCYEKGTIAKGAARFAADQQLITSRKLKATIGFKQDLIWEPSYGPRPKRSLIAPDSGLKCIVNSIRCLFWKGQTIKTGDSASFIGNLILDPPLFAVEQAVYAAGTRKRNLELREVDASDGQFLIIDDPDNQVVELGNMGLLGLDRTDISAQAYNARGQLKTQYRITATFHGEELTFVLDVPSNGHFVCGGPCKKRTPEQGRCPGPGRILSHTCPIGTMATFVSGNGPRKTTEEDNENEEDRDDISLASTNDSDEDYVDGND